MTGAFVDVGISGKDIEHRLGDNVVTAGTNGFYRATRHAVSLPPSGLPARTPLYISLDPCAVNLTTSDGCRLILIEGRFVLVVVPSRPVGRARGIEGRGEACAALAGVRGG